MSYALPADVRAAATGDALTDMSDEVLAAAASEVEPLVDAFTGRWFDAQTRTLVALIDARGRVALPVAPTGGLAASIESVKWRSNGVDIPAGSWTYVPPAPGMDPVLVIGGRRTGSDILVAGAEPWRGGWAALSGQDDGVIVTGSFGEPGVPFAVRRATAMLAAWVLGADLAGVDDTGIAGVSSMTNVRSISVEGTSVTFDVPVPATEGYGASTGLEAADRLLAGQCRRRTLRIG